MPKLRDLDARFIQHKTGIADAGHGRVMPDGSTQWGGFETEEMHTVATLAEAHSIWFGCPKCYGINGNTMKGTHSVMVSFEGRNLPEGYGSRNSEGKPSRWAVSGTGLDDLVLTPSIFLKVENDKGEPLGCYWHGFVGSNGVPPGEAA